MGYFTLYTVCTQVDVSYLVRPLPHIATQFHAFQSKHHTVWPCLLLLPLQTGFFQNLTITHKKRTKDAILRKSAWLVFFSPTTDTRLCSTPLNSTVRRKWFSLNRACLPRNPGHSEFASDTETGWLRDYSTVKKGGGEQLSPTPNWVTFTRKGRNWVGFFKDTPSSTGSRPVDRGHLCIQVLDKEDQLL